MINDEKCNALITFFSENYGAGLKLLNLSFNEVSPEILGSLLTIILTQNKSTIESVFFVNCSLTDDHMIKFCESVNCLEKNKVFLSNKLIFNIELNQIQPQFTEKFQKRLETLVSNEISKSVLTPVLKKNTSKPISVIKNPILLSKKYSAANRE